jgi:signal transduction histidine kinase
MSFRVAARTILHLGSELISSDGVALYELIKNSYDARSPNVEIQVLMVLARRAQRDTLSSIREARKLDEDEAAQLARLEGLKRICLAHVIEGASTTPTVREAILEASSLDQLEYAVREANTITVRDSGIGMSLVELDDAFLTIGTRSKQRIKDEGGDEDGPAILGEKGIGRLSAMRLGDRLRVRTAKQTDKHWNELEIDWSAFDHASDALIESINLSPTVDGLKTPPNACGTEIYIRGLHRDWSRPHVEEIARDDFARLNDPFAKALRFPIILRYNSELLTIPRLEGWILQHAHGHCSGQFRELPQSQLVFSGEMEAAGKIDNFSYSKAELLSAAKVPSLEVLQALGPFSVEFYWFNRKILTALEGVGDLATVRARLAQWTGGLMVFRDGFRVPPYGSPDDDWLDLDRIAFSRGGYKLNRTQIIGRVSITQRGNPRLRDQANREGLIDNEEKRALQRLLAHLIQQTFWSFMVLVEKSAQAAREPASEAVIEQRLVSEESRLLRNLALLEKRVPAVRHEAAVLAEIRESIDNMMAVMDQVRQLAREYEEGRTQLLNLAGVGLTVEILAHELNRATETALLTLTHLPTLDLNDATVKSLNGLSAQLKTLQKRLRVLDPLSTSGRNRKEKIDLTQLVKDVLESHAEHFEREGIQAVFRVLPAASSRLILTVVRGMIVQVLENLISNSLYWLRQQKRITPEFQPRLFLELNTMSKELRLSDNGPGISDGDKDKVFEAFFTKRPAGEGKGLGLFISREIAKYHGAELRLEPDDEDMLRTFVLDLSEVR